MRAVVASVEQWLSRSGASPEAVDARATRVSTVSLILLLCTPLYVGLAVVGEHPEAVPADIVCGLLYAVPFLWVRSGANPRVAGHLVCAAGTLHTTSVMWFSGGLQGGLGAAMLLVPIAATLLVDIRAGWSWFAAVAVALLVVSRLDPAWFVHGLPESVFARQKSTAHILVLTGAFFQIAVAIYDRSNTRQTAALAEVLNGLEQRVEERTAALAAEVEERRNAERAALQASRAKSAFLANMSHELRTPLNAIVGYAEMVDEELAGTREDLRQDLDQVVTSANHLTRLIDGILDLARIERDQLTLELEEFDVAELLGEVVAMVRPEFEARGNTLGVHEPPESVRIRSDPTRVRQIVLNLLANGNRFTDRGQVTMSIERQSDVVTIRVADTGIGIPPEKLASIFERFVQVDDSTTRRSGGAGLGLAISRGLAEHLGGSLTAASTVGRGSTFELRLPARSADGLDGPISRTPRP